MKLSRYADFFLCSSHPDETIVAVYLKQYEEILHISLWQFRDQMLKILKMLQKQFSERENQQQSALGNENPKISWRKAIGKIHISGRLFSQFLSGWSKKPLHFSAERIFIWFFVAYFTTHYSTPRHSKRFLPTQLSSLDCNQTIKP